jgi:hypothetical protein
MEILKHERKINPENIEEAKNFLAHLRSLTVRYLNVCDIFVLVKNECGNMTVFEGDIDSDFAVDRITRCLVSNPPPFEIICTIRVVTK